ncbi:MAG: hypothetical protein EBR82_15130 [Caulobacteraceae bacterium]|nr:hypothetical protein [Caulobacteraceae bacterium]
MDPLAELRAALERLAEFRRRAGGPRKQKKVKVANRRPAKMGASAGCGTGAGGFKAGNNCAIEDGIPRKPLSQGGALKSANAKDDLARAKAMREKAAAKKAKKEAADKAKSEATRPQREAARLERKKSAEKQKRIGELRRTAAERKAQKGERDAAEKQSAAEAAAAKKAAMLQKIRIKKANEQLKVIEKPADRFSGQVDESIKKLPGETQVDFAKRRIDADMKRLHEEMDALETRLASERMALLQKKIDLDEAAANAQRQKQAYAQKIIGTDRHPRNPTKDETKEYDRLSGELTKAMKEREENLKRLDLLEKKYNDEAHELISDFVKSHNGGSLSKFDTDAQFANPDHIEKTRSMFAKQFKDNAKEAWSFLSKVSSPIHQQKGSDVKVKLDTDAGGADYDDIAQVARHGTLGSNGNYHTSAAVIVHEVAHGLHYGPRAPRLFDQQGRPMPDAQEKGIEWMNAPGYRARLAIKEDYDARVAKLRAENNGELENVVYHPERQNYRLWVPKGQHRRPRDESYLGYANQYADSENGNETGATEVISVGVEQMFRSARRFRSSHGSHFDLTLLFLAGRLH